MKHIIHIVLIIFILSLNFTIISYAQNTDAYGTNKADSSKATYDKYKLPSIVFGVGITSFIGDLHSKKEHIISFANHNFAIQLGAEKRFGNFLGASLFGLYGQITEKDFVTNFKHYNFQTNIFQGEANVMFHFDNDFLLRKRSRFAPFVFAGIGFMHFNPKSDIYDVNNKKYFYWTNGTIKDRAEDYDNPNLGNPLKRDYTYESKVDTTISYSHTTATFPLGIGLKFKLSDKFESNIVTAYYFALTDYIDNYKSKSNDGYIYSSISLRYNLSGKTKERPKLKDFAINDTVFALDTIGPKDTLKSTFTYIFNDSLNTSGFSIKELIKQEQEPGQEQGGQQLAANEKTGQKRKSKNIIDYTYKYKVQLGAIKNGTSKKYYSLKFDIKEDDIIVDKYEDGYKYSVGFKSLDEAKEFNKNIRNAKNVKTFVVTYQEDKRIFLPSGFNEEKTTEVGGNIVYRVQLASLNNKESKKYFLDKYGIEDNIYIERYQGSYKYYVGSFSTYKGSRQYCDNLRKRNIDSFVICYKDGKRISVKQALKLTNE